MNKNMAKFASNAIFSLSTLEHNERIAGKLYTELLIADVRPPLSHSAPSILMFMASTIFSLQQRHPSIK